jgi:glycoside/pentoside/hexuronide:cation symporter, GPH family
VMSALADIADENELKHGLRQEGVLYSTRALASKMDLAIGTALAGIVISMIKLPAKAVPGEVAPDILYNMALWDGVMASIPGLIAVVFYARYRITLQSYEATKAALDSRRAGLAAQPAE